MRYWTIIDKNSIGVHSVSTPLEGIDPSGYDETYWISTDGDCHEKDRYNSDTGSWEAYTTPVEVVRATRDRKLKDSDYVVLRHSEEQIGQKTLSDTEYQSWVEYRKSLRDFPSTYTPVAEVAYPQAPDYVEPEVFIPPAE